MKILPDLHHDSSSGVAEALADGLGEESHLGKVRATMSDRATWFSDDQSRP